MTSPETQVNHYVVEGAPYSLGCASRDKPHSLEPLSCPPVGEGPTVDLRQAARLWSLRAVGRAGAEGPGGGEGWPGSVPPF